MTKITPINGVIVLKRLENNEQTYGQIVIPDMGKERPELGLVIETSDTYNWHKGAVVKSNLKEGQVVLIPKMGAMAFTIDMEEYILIKETEILCVIEY